MPSKQTVLNRINKELSNLPIYAPEIPVSEIISIVENHGHSVIDEDGEKWEGFLVGESGSVRLDILGINKKLQIAWYKMSSGNFEINSYIA